MKKILQVIIILLLSLALAGCGESSNNSDAISQTVNSAKIQNIQEDMTTEEVEAELGAPEFIEEDFGKIGAQISDQSRAVKEILENESLDIELKYELEAEYTLLQDILKKILEFDYEVVIYSYNFEEENEKGKLNIIFIDNLLAHVGVNVEKDVENV